MQFENVEISTKDPRTVVLMLDSPEVVIVCKACEALKKYVEICKCNMVALISAQLAVMSLSILIQHTAESNCLEVLQLDSLPRLVKLLSSTEKVIRSYAVLCLASMVENGQCLLTPSYSEPDL